MSGCIVSEKLQAAANSSNRQCNVLLLKPHVVVQKMYKFTVLFRVIGSAIVLNFI